MSERTRIEELVRRKGAKPGSGGAGGTSAAIANLQRSAGNRAVTQLLQRDTASGTAPAPGTTSAYAPDWSTKEKAEATAEATRKRLRSELLPFMAKHSNQVIRNTAEFFTGPRPLLAIDAITQRADAADRLASSDAPGWADPTLFSAFFLGTKMDNTLFNDKQMTGTLTGGTMYLRGHTSAGTPETLETMAGEVAHEVSHWLVSQYGELPKTDKDASSFDRYADEFRAYWIMTGGPGDGLTGDARASAIRTHLVGTVNDPASGYPELHKAYFKGGDNEFRVDVDLMTAPVGFNLSNSLRLHLLWQTLRQYEGGRPDVVDDMVLWISGLSIAERKEAQQSALVKKLVAEMRAADRDRVNAALAAMVSDAYAAFVDAINRGSDADVKSRFLSLSADDRHTVGNNAGFLYATEGATKKDLVKRACVYAMVSTGNAAQYDAMRAFLDALVRARADAAIAEIPDDVADALGKLKDEARWTFLSWSQEAVKQFVDVLPPAVARALREKLRD